MTSITLKVGDSTFETTKAKLQAQDSNSYFHAQFLGRWNCNDVEAFDVKERSGPLF